MKKTLTILCLLLTCGFGLHAGDTLRVLFLGNSYTEVNNLPDVISKIAKASGDSLYYKVNAPGGYTFEQHSSDPTSLGLIAQGNWDFVVLQEQSQRPSFHDAQVEAEVYPYAKKLDSLIRDEMGECARVMYYMTWGRKNGDASNCAVWPPVCTYEGMDSLLQLRYNIMADSNNSFISPVAKVWRNLRDNNPGIELYQPDESHPSAAGTYAAAMSFYTMLFEKHPLSNSFNYTLSAANANAIKAAAETEVYAHIFDWKKHSGWPHVDSISAVMQSGNTVKLTAINPGNVVGYRWIFGDSTPDSYQANPEHTYADDGTYTACLIVSGICGADTFCVEVDPNTTGINETGLMKGIYVYPNPVQDYIIVDGLKSGTSYSILDVTGAKIDSGNISPANNKVELPEMATGLYFLHLSNEKGETLITKIIRQ